VSHEHSPAGTALGTVDICRSEQALGKELDPRTDLFSSALVLYEMATGRLPFREEKPPPQCSIPFFTEHRSRLCASSRPAFGLKKSFNKALEKRLQPSYQHAADMRADLQRLKRDTIRPHRSAEYANGSCRVIRGGSTGRQERP